ncbi:MAG: hypothetical protein KJ709_07135 [Nanoarchaeota archaeon]|nr:hypothetical protein [Nanoarchaeota archaeon]
MNKRPDPKKAQSIIISAERDMKFTLTLKPTEDSSATIIRNIYESFRMLGEALLVRRGVRSYDHVSQIDELINLNVKAERPLRVLENLRSLRHNINYHGYSPKRAEVMDTLDIAKTLFSPLLAEVKHKIGEKTI